MSNFQKNVGGKESGALATTISRSVGSALSSATKRGNSEYGKRLVDVTMDGGSPSNGVAECGANVSNAIPVKWSPVAVQSGGMAWGISDNRLTVIGASGSTSVITFWVF